jgi:hypothetical protein
MIINNLSTRTPIWAESGTPNPERDRYGPSGECELLISEQSPTMLELRKSPFVQRSLQVKMSRKLLNNNKPRLNELLGSKDGISELRKSELKVGLD